MTIIITLLVFFYIVQSLNCPFFPSHIGAEPGRAKRESRITCMRMLRTPPPPPPLQIGGKPYLEVLFRFSLWRDFLNNNIQATISAFWLVRNISINSKSVEFHQCHAKRHSVCFLPQYQSNEEIFVKICWQLKTTRPTFLSKTFANSLNMHKQYEKNVWEKCNDAHSLSLRVQTTINHNINGKEKIFFSERELKKALRDTLTQRGIPGYVPRKRVWCLRFSVLK